MVDRQSPVRPEKAFTHRERVLRSISHAEPDRVPVDLGSMDATTINGIAYSRLKAHFGIRGGAVQIYDPYAQTAKVETEVLERIGGDVLAVFPEASEYRDGLLTDGSPCQLPAKWNPLDQPDGSQIIVDDLGKTISIRPPTGLFFEPLDQPLQAAETVADIEKDPKVFETYDWPSFWDRSLEEMGEYARRLFEETDYLIFGNFPCHIFQGSQLLRGFETFFVDLLERPLIAQCVMENLARAFMDRFDRYAEFVGPYVQVINVNDDLGTQQWTQISPELYRRMVKPYHAMIYGHIKKKWPGHLFFHSDGAILPLLPDLIELGIEILNPVQYTARGMVPRVLKREFGSQLTFWGGGCDTQRVLPYGTPEQVKEEVRRQIGEFAPGGGFVFCQVSNILPDMPTENVVAMYEAVATYGGY
jgi:uroporphyrinogen decarboxylase